MKCHATIRGYIPILLLAAVSHSLAAEDVIPADERVYLPEEAVKLMKDSQTDVVAMRIDYQRLSEGALHNNLPQPGNDAPLVVTPVKLFDGTSPVLEGDAGTATATAIYFNSLKHKFGDGGESNLELVSLLYGISFTEAQILSDITDEVIASFEGVANEERKSACSRFDLSQPLAVDTDDVNEFLKHLDRIEERSMTHYLEVYADLTELLPTRLADMAIASIDSAVVRTTETDFYSILRNDNAAAGRLINGYCSAHMARN